MKKSTSAIHGATFFLSKGTWRYAILFFLMPTADRRKRKCEEMGKAEAASCRNLMKFFSRYIKCFTRRKIV
jgi:hypothetical protein